ncbi:glycosyltransferase family 4 protein [Marinicrinis lubricantis]|uniref:Glycosyltransferase family 4 protein n=1 Tax=Marinicrinis lubricantis TaxID=2086470 RepID=A0ABW1IKG3_9BACL
MKVLIFNTLYYPNIVGGAEKSVQLLAEGLVQLGIQPVIVSTAKEDKVQEVNGVKVYYLSHRNLYWGVDSKSKPSYQKMLWHGIDSHNPFMARKVKDIIAVERPDVIHTNNITGLSTAPWIVARNMGIPVAHTLRDFSLMCVKSTMFKANQNCEKRCSSCSLYTESKKRLSNQGYVHHLIGNSQFMIDRHQHFGYFQNTPSSRIFNGAVIQSPTLDFKKIGEKRRLKFLYMGRIEETKGVKLLLDTFQDLDNAELLLAGKVYDEQIQANLDNSKYPDHITFLGYTNPSDILPEVDMLIAPSIWHEPLPRVILEAYSYGKPVIGSNRGGIPECIEEGKTGFIFDPNQPESLRSNIERIINYPNLLREMSLDLENYLKQFNIQRTINEYCNVYKQISNS